MRSWRAHPGRYARPRWPRGRAQISRRVRMTLGKPIGCAAPLLSPLTPFIRVLGTSTRSPLQTTDVIPSLQAQSALSFAAEAEHEHLWSTSVSSLFECIRTRICIQRHPSVPCVRLHTVWRIYGHELRSFTPPRSMFEVEGLYRLGLRLPSVLV